MIALEYASWAWPQWTMVFFLMLRLVLVPILMIAAGAKLTDEDAWSRMKRGIFRAALLLALLIAGGFFA